MNRPETTQQAAAGAAPSAREDARYGVRMRSYFMAAGTSLLAMGLLWIWHLAGMLGRWQLILVEALVAGCLVGFYVAFRTGWNRRFADPSLTVPQMAAASFSMLVGAFVADSGRALFLVLVMMVLMFGVLRLRTRALLTYTGCNLAGYALVIVLLWWFRPAALDLRLELLQLLVLAVTMPWFALMGGYITGLRERIKSALRAVESSERSLAEAQRMARFGSWSFDSATHTAYWSVETYRIFGLDARADALSGAEFRSLVHPDDRQRYAQLIEQAARDGGELTAEYRIVLPSGAIRWVHALARPVPKEGGPATLLRGTVMDITERKEAEDQIRQLAHFDALTGLPNRNLLMQLLRQAIADTERHDTPLAIFFIDLDGFKKVNDTLGHDAGDLLLTAFAQRLGHSLRRSDIAARLGGDEFVVLVKDFGGGQDLEALADRLLAAAAVPFQIEGEACSVSASIGIATYPDAGTDVDALIKSADGAMYQAKHQGRNRFALMAATP